MLSGKKIIVGICGSIAAYKSAILVRGLIRAGAEVRVLMTRAATDFISPLTLATLSKHAVTTSVHDGQAWNNHVELGLWADAMVIAPATATTLGKLANGICDSAVVAVYLSARCPVFFAPAMDLDMWAHPATRRNVQLLQSYGNHLINVGEGELASGLSGAGRMAEPEDIIQLLAEDLGDGARVPSEVDKSSGGRNLASATADQTASPSLSDQTVLITAGPTFEDLDPVRYLGNRSTGRMGIALAEAAADRGATVHLILGPTNLAAGHPRVTTHAVRSAREMHAVALRYWPTCDLGILAAAVADYRPAIVAEQKIKKSDGELDITLVRNPDIAADLGRQKADHQRLIGFALETENGLENARRKLAKKNLDLIVLNSPNDPGAAFGHPTNQVQLVTAETVTAFGLKDKRAVAEDILDAV